MFEVNTMSVPDFPDIVETPKHFWFGSTDLAYACQGDTKTEKLPGGYIKVTKSFIAKSYSYDNQDGLYDFIKPKKQEK